MRSIRLSTTILLSTLLLGLFCLSAAAQDAVVISEGNFLRGTIKSTNFISVILQDENDTYKEFFAKDIKEFNWNGDTYVSKPIVVKKRMEHRFFKLVSYGAVNLYAFGGNTGVAEEAPAAKRPRIRPNVGVGMGSGMGSGVGGGISIDLGGRRNAEPVAAKRSIPSFYFIERLGSPMQQLPINLAEASPADPTTQMKSILLQKLTGNAAIEQRIKDAPSFDEKELIALIKDYNATQPTM
jgi:hypothetical protein